MSYKQICALGSTLAAGVTGAGFTALLIGAQLTTGVERIWVGIGATAAGLAVEITATEACGLTSLTATGLTVATGEGVETTATGFGAAMATNFGATAAYSFELAAAG